jgi:glyoxylase-like metal-dependent hydrolase (beta-lactamase superfamily II)
MAGIPFVSPIDPLSYATIERVAPRVERVIARNPNHFTFTGTGTYLIGSPDPSLRECAVVDPGPDVPEHRQALEAVLADRHVTAIVVTHCHSDHVGLAAWLKELTGAPTVAWKPHGAVGLLDNDDDIEVMKQLAPPPKTAEEVEAEKEIARQAGLDPDDFEVRETVDTDFVPDVRVDDGGLVAEGDGWTLRGVHTPGHTSNHMCVALEEERALFTGDHVMGWSTTVVSPPDGDMRAYLSSLDKVRRRGDAVLWPTHGAPVTDPGPFLDAYYEHRLSREKQVLEAIADGLDTVVPMVRRMYAAVSPHLHVAAARSVLSHLTQLVDEGRLRTVDGGPARLSSTYVI